MSSSSLKRKLIESNEANSLSSRSEILNRKLLSRPDRHQLIEKRILLESQCAPSLQCAEHSLKRARLQDELNNLLSNRPGPLDLIQNNILHIDTTNKTELEKAIQGCIDFFQTNHNFVSNLIHRSFFGKSSFYHF